MNDTLFDMSIYESSKETNQKVSGRKRLRSASRDQMEFKIGSIDDLIAQNHRARDVWEYVSLLDLSSFHEDIRVTENGNGPGTLDPKIAMALWLFATLNGVISAREIDRLSKEHHAYIWICGGVSVNYHSLSDFRTKDTVKFTKMLRESIAIMWKTGTFEPNEVAQDGTKVKANAGKNLLKREATLEEYLRMAEFEISRLENELKTNPCGYSLRQKTAKERAARERKERVEQALLEMSDYKKSRIEECKRNSKKLSEADKDKLRISIVDPECRKMKMGMGGYRPAFNVQFATTTEQKIIVGVDVVNTQDPGTLVSMMSQVQENLAAVGCSKATIWLADSAYANNGDVNSAAESFPDVTLYAPPTGNQHADKFSERKNDSPAMKELRMRMSRKESAAIYSKRCSTAEFANAVVKNRGMTEFLTKGLSKATNMALIYAVMHNMMRYWGV